MCHCQREFINKSLLAYNYPYGWISEFSSHVNMIVVERAGVVFSSHIDAFTLVDVMSRATSPPPLALKQPWNNSCLLFYKKTSFAFQHFTHPYF
jgi:hypothetical protein